MYADAGRTRAHICASNPSITELSTGSLVTSRPVSAFMFCSVVRALCYLCFTVNPQIRQTIQLGMSRSGFFESESKSNDFEPIPIFQHCIDKIKMNKNKSDSGCPLSFTLCSFFNIELLKRGTFIIYLCCFLCVKERGLTVTSRNC